MSEPIRFKQLPTHVTLGQKKSFFSGKTPENMENRENLQLTAQMLSELGRMKARIDYFHDTVLVPIESQMATIGRLTLDLTAKIQTATAELNTFKVILENMLCETDIKAKSSWKVAALESDII